MYDEQSSVNRSFHQIPDKMSVTSKDSYWYLSIDDANDEDVGEYEAIASNTAGQVGMRE